MKKIIALTITIITALILTACGSAANSASTNSNSASTAVPQQGGSQIGGLSGLQLAAGMIKLDGTSNAITAQEASQLLPLWQTLQQDKGTPVSTGNTQNTPGARPNTGMMQQISAQLTSIENAMTPAQLQAITAMNLSRQDIFAAFQQAGISMGGPGGGNGVQSGNGTFTPPFQGTPGAFRGNGNFGQNGTPRPGGRGGFGGYIPPSVVNGIVQYLQQKASS